MERMPGMVEMGIKDRWIRVLERNQILGNHGEIKNIFSGLIHIKNINKIIILLIIFRPRRDFLFRSACFE